MGFPLLSPADLRWDRNMVVGGDIGPRVPHTSHVFGNKEKLLIWAYCWLFGGSDGVALGCPKLQLGEIPPVGPDEVD